MRRWLLIILLLVYPFQATLAMADQCCVTTPAGVSHHGADGTSDKAVLASLIADDASSPLADPHCPACVFGHLSGVPVQPPVLPVGAHQPAPVVSVTPFFTSLPAPRPERPQWPAAAF